MAHRKIALLTDSCADIPPSQARENGIFIAPLRILCADGEYRDGVDITPQDVYDRLRKGDLPKTSLPSGEDIQTTRRIALALDAVDITLADHIVVADDDYVSLVQSGYYHPGEARVII
jgi:fatty acid-binding protein DegV